MAAATEQSTRPWLAVVWLRTGPFALKLVKFSVKRGRGPKVKRCEISLTNPEPWALAPPAPLCVCGEIYLTLPKSPAGVRVHETRDVPRGCHNHSSAPLTHALFERRYVQQRGYGARNLRHAHAALCGPHRASMALCRARLSVQSLARLCLRPAIYLSAQSSGTGAPSSSAPRVTGMPAIRGCGPTN